MHLLKTAVAAAIALSALADARAAAYIKFDGIDGEVVEFEGTLSEFRWTSALAGPSFDPFHAALAGGVRVASGDLDGDGRAHYAGLALTAADEGGTYFRYELKDVIVSSYDLSSAARCHHDCWVIIESTQAPVMRWAPRTDNGGRSPWISATWDPQTGRLLGDAEVLGAFQELGAVRLYDGTLAVTAAVPEPGSWALMLLGAAVVGSRLRQQRRLA